MYEVYSIHHEWPETGNVFAQVGAPQSFDPDRDYTEVARELEEVMRETGREGVRALDLLRAQGRWPLEKTVSEAL